MVGTADNPLTPVAEDPSMSTPPSPSILPALDLTRSAPGNGVAVPELDPAVIPDLDKLITEDGKPVDNLFTEKQYRLLTEPLHSSWAGPGEGRPFLAVTDVGLFYVYGQTPLAPDAMLSLDVPPSGSLHAKENRSYFVWVIGKVPEVVIEIVSDKRGGEDTFKKQAYARMGILFYVIFDPENVLEQGVLRAFVLQRGRYEPVEPNWLPEVGLGLTLWEGIFEGHRETWLRWCDRDGRVIPTGAERAEAVTEKLRRLEAQLRALGHEPDLGGTS
jgi:Uma2 family endonuclease